MKGCGGHLLLLGVVALLLEEGSGFPSSHALRNFRMAVSEPGPGLPRFIAVSYVDDQPIVHYDSHTRRTVPVAPWMRKVEQDEPRYFEEESQVFRGDEKLFNETLVTLMDHFHHDNRTGLHTLQLKISCKVWADGRPIGGSQKYAYEGKDLFVLNTETLTWKACVPQAKNLKKKLGSILGLAHPQREMDYLKETCVDSLRKYLVYGNKTLLRTGSSSSHSLRIFRMVVSEPGPGLPQFIAVGYVDDQTIFSYDSHTRRTVPIAPWTRKVEQDEPHYFEEESQVFRGDEELFKETLEMLMTHFHHHSSTGLHTFQLMISCEVWSDGRPRGGSWKYAYDGEDLLVLNTETPTWKACVPKAKILKQKLGLAHPQREKAYLEEPCVDSLRKYLEYRNETLPRTESPTVKVARKKDYDGRVTLFCQVYGFYPKEIEVTWMKDGKDRKRDTLTGGIIPNSDGTYHTWLSIGVVPKDRDCYRCRVEHKSLPGPREWVWEIPRTNLILLLGIYGSILVVAIIVAFNAD